MNSNILNKHDREIKMSNNNYRLSNLGTVFNCPNCGCNSTVTQVEIIKSTGLRDLIGSKSSTIAFICINCTEEFSPSRNDNAVPEYTKLSDQNRVEPVFLETLVFCMSKVALVDGELHNQEIQSICDFIKEISGTVLTAERVIELLNSVETENVSIDDYVRQRKGSLSKTEKEVIVRACLRISNADGHIDSAESILLRETISLFGIDDESLRHIYTTEGL